MGALVAPSVRAAPTTDPVISAGARTFKGTAVGEDWDVFAKQSAGRPTHWRVAPTRSRLQAQGRLVHGISGHWWRLADRLDDHLAWYGDLAVDHVRLNFDWDRIEPEPGARVWAPYDTIVPALQRQGITVIGVFVTLPAWAANDPAGCVDNSTQRERCLGIRFGLEQHLADLCAELVQRHRLTHLEFWNEPDLWPGLSDPIAYAHWLWWATQGARQANPTIKIAAAREKGAEFFAPIYRDYLPTKPRVFDALSLHPYWPRSAADLTRVDALQAMLREYADDRTEIWVTEFGWDSSTIDPAIHATGIAESMLELMARPYIAVASLHQLNDIASAAYAPLEAGRQAYGLIEDPVTTDSVRPKPAYAAFREVATRGGTVGIPADVSVADQPDEPAG